MNVITLVSAAADGFALVPGSRNDLRFLTLRERSGDSILNMPVMRMGILYPSILRLTVWFQGLYLMRNLSSVVGPLFYVG